MAKDPIVQRRSHHWILVEHKRGVARCCLHCGKLRYYGKHKEIKHTGNEGIVVIVPVYKSDLDNLAMMH